MHRGPTPPRESRLRSLIGEPAEHFQGQARARHTSHHHGRGRSRDGREDLGNSGALADNGGLDDGHQRGGSGTLPHGSANSLERLLGGGTGVTEKHLCNHTMDQETKIDTVSVEKHYCREVERQADSDAERQLAAERRTGDRLHQDGYSGTKAAL